VFSYVALLIFYIIAAIFIGVMGIIATVFLFIACHHEETKNKGFILTSAILSILFVILFPFIVLTFVLGILLFFAYVLMIVFIILALIKNKYDVTILASSENISVGKQSVNNKQQLAKIAKENDVHENLEK
jgi:predicted membrane protein